MKKILSLLLALCLVVGLLPLAAMAADELPEKYVRAWILQGTETSFWKDVYMTPGAPTMYLVTNAEGAAAEGTDQNWNIKMEYPADGTATLTFKGANLVSTYSKTPLQINATADLKIVVETDSTIFSDVKGPGIHLTSTATTTITGPGKLTIKAANSFCIWATTSVSKLDGGAVIIKDANLDLYPNAESSTYPALYFTGGDMTIDNSKVHINDAPKTMGIWGYTSVSLNADGTVKSLSYTFSTGKNDNVKRNLIIQNGSEVTGANTGRTGIGANGDIIIKDSTVEFGVASAENNFAVFSKKPILEGNYTAIASENKDGSGAVPYVESDYANHRYFKITPKAAGGTTTGGTTTGGTTTGGTTTGGTTTGGTTTNPSTGDTFSVALVSALALASMATLAAVTVIGKKKAI